MAARMKVFIKNLTNAQNIVFESVFHGFITVLAYDTMHSCEPLCACKWREILDQKLIYSISEPVRGHESIYTAIRDYMARREERVVVGWSGWTDGEVEVFVGVVKGVSRLRQLILLRKISMM